jgi:hypothetical protein
MVASQGKGLSHGGARRAARLLLAPLAVAALALTLAAPALAAGGSITLNGPSSNLYGTPFKYTASGVAKGPANYVYGWEASYSVPCASTYGAESKREAIYLFVSKSVRRNAHFSLIVDFFAQNLEKHRFCAYLVNKATHKTYAHAAASWSNHAASTTTPSTTTGGLQPTMVGQGDCQAMHFTDESVYAQIAVSYAKCTTAEAVAFGADAAKGAAYQSGGFSCSATAEGAGSTWASAWGGTYYAYRCVDGSEQIAFNWGVDYTYVPAASLPAITAPS